MTASPESGVTTYLWSDSWLLYAIIHASREEPADLAKIIAVGDHYNHAVFTYDELYGGLDRLTSGGWVISSNQHFSASPITTKEYALIQGKGLSCFDEMKSLEITLNSKVL